MRISVANRFEDRGNRVIVEALHSSGYSEVNLAGYYPFPERTYYGKVGSSVFPLFKLGGKPSTVLEVRNPFIRFGRTLVLPGGHVEHCSNPVETAIKEFVEEIQLIREDELLVPYPADHLEMISFDIMETVKEITRKLKEVYGVEINRVVKLPLEFVVRGLDNLRDVTYKSKCNNNTNIVTFHSYVDIIPHDGIHFVLPAILRFEDIGIKPEEVEVLNFEFGGEIAFIQSLRALLFASPEYFHPVLRPLKDIIVKDAMKLFEKL